MPHRKWSESVLLKLKQAKMETGALPGASTRVPLSGYEIAQLIEVLEPSEILPLFRWHNHDEIYLPNSRESTVKKERLSANLRRRFLFYSHQAKSNCVWEGSNLRPLSYQDSVLPLNYTREIY